MCDPATLTLAAAGVAAAGTAVTAVQSSAQANYQAKVADQNAKLETERQRSAQEGQALERKQLARRYAELKGAQNAALAANGIDATFGSAQDVASDTLMFQNEDAQALASNQANEIRGFDISAGNFRAEAQGKRQEATGALIGGAFSAASTVLGGVSQYQQLKAKGYGPQPKTKGFG